MLLQLSTSAHTLQTILINKKLHVTIDAEYTLNNKNKFSEIGTVFVARTVSSLAVSCQNGINTRSLRSDWKIKLNKKKGGGGGGARW